MSIRHTAFFVSAGEVTSTVSFSTADITNSGEQFSIVAGGLVAFSTADVTTSGVSFSVVANKMVNFGTADIATSGNTFTITRANRIHPKSGFLYF